MEVQVQAHAGRPELLFKPLPSLPPSFSCLPSHGGAKQHKRCNYLSPLLVSAPLSTIPHLLQYPPPGPTTTTHRSFLPCNRGTRGGGAPRNPPEFILNDEGAGEKPIFSHLHFLYHSSGVCARVACVCDCT